MGYGRKPTICRACLALLVVCLASLPPFTHASDSISMGQSLRDGQTIVSVGDKFELGFFTPPNSTGRYVGIWYYKIPSDAVIWIANRDSPIPNLSGVLTFAADGNLVVQDGNHTVWSTNVNATILNVTAQVSEFGNLVLQDRFQKWWESFENPTDTYLPGMRTGLDKRTGRNTLFHSWRSPGDPTTGNFSMGVDPQGRAQIVVFEGSRRHWRSGLWDGQTFTGIPAARPHYPYGFRLSDDDQEDKIYFTYTLFDPSALLRFVLTWDGIEEQLLWNKTSQTWKRLLALPIAECEYYGKCGAFGVCRSWATHRCECIKGYVPQDEGEWQRGNWSGGCVKKVALKCERRNQTEVTEEDGFYSVGNVKLPDFSETVTADGKDTCEKRCLSNCSCRAYAYDKGIGCAIWQTELVDIEQYNGLGNVLYLRLANSELEKRNKLPTFAIVIIVLGGVLFVAAAYLLCRKRKMLRGPWKRVKETQIPVFDFGNDVDIPTDSSGSVAIGERTGKGHDLPLVSFSFVASVTNNFSYENKLGQGGFGPVYKGMLPSGQVVAIKRLSKLSGQGLEEFKNEVMLIARLQHRNLVRLVGFCVEGEEKMLLYEYMPNKSLDAFLFDARYRPMLDWTKRFNIILGIARGLVYLHRDSRLRIIHRDLKPSNILLDEEMNPKISDFGMARIFGGNQNHANTNRVVGTYGYMSPEYAMEGLFSTKSDVYSFGVLLLEIVGGKKNAYFCHPDSLLKLLAFAWRLWNTDRAIDFVDPSIRDSCVMDEVMRCILVGLLCVQDERVDRPDMSAVVLMLESEVANHLAPKQPTFIFAGISRETVLEQHTKSSSGNEVSKTLSTGR